MKKFGTPSKIVKEAGEEEAKPLTEKERHELRDEMADVFDGSTQGGDDD